MFEIEFFRPSLTCQSGRWAKNYRVNQPVVRHGTYGNLNGDIGVAYCASDEIVVGGGGGCLDPKRSWVHDSLPVEGNGWLTNCYGRGMQNWQEHIDTPAIAYAICLRKQ